MKMKGTDFLVKPYGEQWGAIYDAGEKMQVIVREAREIANRSCDPDDAKAADAMESSFRKFLSGLSATRVRLI